MKKMQAGGVSASGAIVIILVLALAGIAGWQVWRKDRPVSSVGKNSQTDSRKKLNDPSEAGKYLVISEWGARVAIPTELKGAVTYSLGEIMADPDGNQLQAAKILIANTNLVENTCATLPTSLGPAVDSGTQYIRSETSKPFNASRYRWNFKEDILINSGYAYHLNYVTPDCLGGGPNAPKIEALQAVLSHLEKLKR